MSQPRWRRGPRALRRPQVSLDNVALVPAHLLPRRAEYQALANQFPAAAILLVLPPVGSPERATMARVAATFRAQGRRVTVLTEERLEAVARR